MTIRVALADDAVLLREGLARLLVEAGFEVVGQAGEALALLALVERSRPDVAVVDIRMPPTYRLEGLEAALELRRRHPGIGVLVLSQHLETSYALELLQDDGGGVGYLLKERVTDVGQLADAVRRVADGRSVVDQDVVAALLGRRRRHDPLGELTEREREVLGLMAEGRSNPAIAAALHLAPKTVENHVGAVFRKLGLAEHPDDHRRVLAVLTFLRNPSP